MNKEYTVHNTNEDLESLELEGVYLIRNLDNNMLKIGVASNLSRRFKQLISTFKHVGEKPNLKIECFIECKDTYGLESYLHEKFKKYNYQNEWFDIQDINYILIVIDTYEFKKIIQKDKSKNTKIIKIKENNIKKEFSKIKKDPKRKLAPLEYAEYQYYKINYRKGEMYIRSKYVKGIDIECEMNVEIKDRKRQLQIFYTEPKWNEEEQDYIEDGK